MPGVALNYKESRSLLPSTSNSTTITDGIRVLLSWLQTLQIKNSKLSNNRVTDVAPTSTTASSLVVRPLDLVKEIWSK